MDDRRDECEQFLARQKSWIRAVLKGDYGSPDIPPAMAAVGGIEELNKARDQYEEVLNACPKHLKEYRKLAARLGARTALFGVPSLVVGAPRKDWLAQECWQLQQIGLSQPEIAREMNLRYPDLRDKNGNLRPISKEVVRKHLASLRKGAPRKEPD